jgi:hypothetical protein
LNCPNPPLNGVRKDRDWIGGGNRFPFPYALDVGGTSLLPHDGRDSNTLGRDGQKSDEERM